MANVARLLLSLLLPVLIVGCSGMSPGEKTIDLTRHFGEFDGCFVMLDVERDHWIRYNPERCNEPFSPCSTFKIPNSLIGLETGVIEDANHVYEWDEVERTIPAWNRDHDLRSAIKHSVVWYYQQLAQEVGENLMRQTLAKLDYGNQDISGGLTTFWLGSTLKISANEQVAFLRKLVTGKLPFSQRSQDIVKEIMIVSEEKGSILRGKTGSNWKDGEYTLGWFVGYLIHDNRTYIFATNISGPARATGWRAKEITLGILDELVKQHPPTKPRKG